MEDPRAIVSLDIEHDEEVFRQYYFDKLMSLKSILLEEVSGDLVFDPNYLLESGKEISRIYLYLEPVKLMRKTDWPKIYEFFYKNMDRLETFFWEYKDYIKE